MIDTPTQPLDLPAIVARIDRDMAEAAKLRQEREKFIAEQHKLLAEKIKLTAEAMRPNRYGWLTPAMVLALTGLVGFLAGLVTGFNIGHL